MRRDEDWYRDGEEDEPDSWDSVAEDEYSDRRRTGMPRSLIVLIVIGAVAVGSLCLMFVFSKGFRDGFTKGLTGELAEDDLGRPSPDDDSRYEEIAAAYNSDDVGVDDVLFEELKNTFTKLSKAIKVERQPGFLAMVDQRRLAETIRGSDFMPASLRMEGVDSIREWEVIDALSDFDEFQIAFVQLADSGDDAIVYLHTWTDSGEESRMRFWMTRNDGNWQFFDWEYIDFGRRYSAKEAILFELASELRHVNFDSYMEFDSDIDKVIEADESGDVDKETQFMRTAQSRFIPEGLQGRSQVQLGFTWSYIGRQANAVQFYREALKTRVAPGIHIGLAFSYDALGQTELALKHADRYERMVGRGPEVNSIKARSLMTLGRRSEAAEEFEKVLRILPDDEESLRKLGKCLPTGKLQTLREHLLRTEDPVMRAQRLVAAYSITRHLAAAEMLIEFLKAEAADDSETMIAEARYLMAKGDEAAGSARFLDAVQASEGDERAAAMSTYLYAMSETDRVLEAYSKADDANNAFMILAGVDTEDDEISLEEPQLTPLIEAHRKKSPYDPYLHYAIGIGLENSGQLKEAVAAYRKAHELAEDEYDKDVFAYRLASAAMESEGPEAAYTVAGRTEAVFYTILSELEADGTIDELPKLIALHEAAHPEDSWIQYARALVAIEAGETGNADILLKQLEENDEDWLVHDSSFGVDADLFRVGIDADG